MKTNFDNAVWVFIFVCGLYFLLAGIKVKKVQERRQAGILSIFMAICFFNEWILEILRRVLKDDHSWISIISKIGLMNAGALVAAAILMQIFGYWKFFKKSRESSDEDSRKDNDLKQS